MGAQLEIVICTERGSLENTSKLLVSTLRKFGGSLKNTPIISYQPRKGLTISESTKKFFDLNQVEHRAIVLNTDFVDYPLANKPLACAYHEQNSQAETILFLDSDVLILNEPTQFLELGDADVMLRPVGFKNIGSSRPNDKTHYYWQKLYDLFGVKAHRMVTSLNDQQEILEYYNTGHILSKRSTGLFSQWAENFRRASADGVEPPESHFYLEQSIFGATVSQLELNVKPFKTPYNYPVHFLKNRHSLANHPAFIANFEDIVSLHYHKVFDQPEGKEIMQNKFSKTEIGLEISKMLEEHGVSQSQSGIIERIRNAFKSQ